MASSHHHDLANMVWPLSPESLRLGAERTQQRMLTTEAANEFARLWVEAWNAHDLESTLAHYSEDIVFSSPFVKKIGVDPSGSLSGRDALRAYFEAGLAKFPSLHFHLRFVLVGIDTVTLVYDSVNGLLSAETMALNPAGKVTRVWAQYDRLP